MTQIRSFRNRDLPALADVWIRHWSSSGPSPPVSVATIEQAILSRISFRRETLMVAQQDDEVVAWSHFQGDPEDEATAVICAICFTPEKGLAACDQLLRETESQIAGGGYQRIVVGPVRDHSLGYTGLSPIGHGIGVPAADVRTASLLSRSGYGTSAGLSRLIASTSPYRVPVNREILQLRRTTRVEQRLRVPADLGEASAMSHLDIEQHTLVDHRSADALARVHWWLSDPEAQVMNCAESIMDLGDIHACGNLQPAESFLIASTIQALANRRVFTVETVVDQSQTELISQLQKLNFEVAEQGARWTKSLAIKG